MAVYTVQGSSNIPLEAIKLTKEEAYVHQKNFIRDWPKELDVLFLRYSGFMAGGIVLATSLVSWTHFRKILNVGSKGRILMSFPGTMVPIFITTKLYEEKVTKNVLVMKSDCPLCTQLRFSVIQIFNGVLYPGAIGLLGGLTFASLYKTYPVPATNKLKELIAVYKNLIKPGLTKFQILITINLLASLILPYLQSKELSALYTKAQELEDKETFKE